MAVDCAGVHVKIVYVAGKYRGPTMWAIEQNVRRAEELGLRVAEVGAMPLMPHCNTRYFHGLLEDSFWLEGTLELLRRCDAVILVSGWYGSIGAKGEKEEAERLGLPVFESVAALRHWLHHEGETPPAMDASTARSDTLTPIDRPMPEKPE